MSAIIMDGRAVSAHLIPELKRSPEGAARAAQRRAIVDRGAGGTRSRLAPVRQEQAPPRRGAGVQEPHPRDSRGGCDHRFDARDPRSAQSRFASTTGILLQMPLPERVDRFRLFDAIAPDKDVDAVGASAVIGFYRGQWGRFIPCTTRGVLALLDYYKVPVDGWRARGHRSQRHRGEADCAGARGTAAQCDGDLVSSPYPQRRGNLPRLGSWSSRASVQMSVAHFSSPPT